MRRVLSTALVVMGICGASLYAAPARAAALAPVIYFSPHQDDETISMGASIAESVAAGREVYVVLVTDGSHSAGRTRLCHLKKICLNRAQFSAARDREFVAALSRLGVPTSRISFENVPDGTLTMRQAIAIITKYHRRYPTASLKTMSWLDKAHDHYELGYALNRLCTTHVVTDCRFFQSPMYQTGSPIAHNPVCTPRWGRETNVAVQRAVAEYRLWDPKHGRYGIGYLSVPRQLSYAAAHYTDKYHFDSRNWLSRANEKAAAAWVSTFQHLHPRKESDE